MKLNHGEKMEQARMWEISLLIKNKKSGFGLIELMLVIAISAIALAGILKLRSAKKPSVHSALKEINAVVQKAFSHAILFRTLYQCRFFFDDERKLLKIGYAPVQDLHQVGTEVTPLQNCTKMSNEVYVTHLKISGKEELNKSNIRETWVLFYPEGYTQEVELGIRSSTQEEFLLAHLNPFLGMFKESHA